MVARLPDNRNSAAGNGAESKNFKAGSLLVSSVPAGSDIALEARRGESVLTSEDRQQAIAVAFEAGMHYQAGLDCEDRARAMLVEWSNESRDIATEYASKVGPHWLALISECGEPG